mmetsp:Transcript_4393/g.7675  ORF Transcript_4393/g.7675 Transcript_4393/m.7675 type:complete len:429 (-) Transcript_4393:65-1351(-)
MSIRSIARSGGSFARYSVHSMRPRSSSLSGLIGANGNPIRQWDSLYDDAENMMQASYVSYPLTFLLREAKKGNLQSSDRILEKLWAIGDGDLSTYIIAEDVLDIANNNMQYIRETYGGDFDVDFGWLRSFEHFAKKTREAGDPEAISMLEFDDHGEHSRLVYGIALNKLRKRVTLIFRGTYSEGTADWRRNIQADPCKVSLPEHLLEMSRDASSHIELHRGFYEYMFANKERSHKYQLERYEEIIDNVLGVLKDFPDYHLYITGHSLGGSLALLVAFHVACSDSPLVPKPVTCVSVGSPCIGDQRFLNTFRMLERSRRIRYLRISNSNDPVANLPPFSWYRHVGINLNLEKDKGFQLIYQKECEDDNYDKYGRWKTLASNFTSPSTAKAAVNAHYLTEYLRRLSREKAGLQGIYLEECYQDESIVGDE